MRGNGHMTWLTGLEIIATAGAVTTGANGATISNMARVLKIGQMVPNMRDNMSTVKSMGRELSILQMEVNI